MISEHSKFSRPNLSSNFIRDVSVAGFYVLDDRLTSLMQAFAEAGSEEDRISHSYYASYRVLGFNHLISVFATKLPHVLDGKAVDQLAVLIELSPDESVSRKRDSSREARMLNLLEEIGPTENGAARIRFQWPHPPADVKTWFPLPTRLATDDDSGDFMEIVSIAGYRYTTDRIKYKFDLVNDRSSLDLTLFTDRHEFSPNAIPRIIRAAKRWRKELIYDDRIPESRTR